MGSNEPARLGVTGGIGSGKTSVCRIFNVLGIPVFSADPVARDITSQDPEVKEGINSIAGRNLYSSGELDREELADIIFSRPDLLRQVNSLVHPAVFRKFEEWVKEQSSPYVIMEAAILFESGASEFVDRIASVIAPEKERIERVIKRNNLTTRQVLDRIRNQMADSERIRMSHYIISNSENDMIIPVVLSIHSDMLDFSNSRK